MDRRTFLLAAALAASGARGEATYPAVQRGTPLSFPRDHGSHPAFRTEWWYVTGWVRDDRGRDFGVQITFFRSRPGVAEASRSRFAPTQLLFAHAAIADPVHGALRRDERAARAGFGLASASEATTDVSIGDWSLRLEADRYVARIAARDFALDLAFEPRAPLLLQGERGVSRKGPRDAQASFYYSRPQLAARGTLSIADEGVKVEGVAWLDHEWSSEYLAAEARGWDWTGINFEDGGALMAFAIRDRDGGALWAGGARQAPSGDVRVLAREDVRFTPLRRWRSPRTGVEYPVAMRLDAGGDAYELVPLMDDQELDSRASVGTIYWEGAVRAIRDARPVGRGYLELTGYGGALRI
ncbi:MAG: lipocalin-like domain-containing protein [Burkholderiales bacterium]